MWTPDGYNVSVQVQTGYIVTNPQDSGEICAADVLTSHRIAYTDTL